ncbi:spermatogenesis-associated protein 4-like [Liolophura sinensis]|uniref:spermatogenesis-associated protein 4-like n=1 Tax=Liolophura sinensis TaxID=3198878 RepID=UPI003158F259
MKGSSKPKIYLPQKQVSFSAVRSVVSKQNPTIPDTNSSVHTLDYRLSLYFNSSKETMSGLTREVIKWIQSLDLTWQIKTPKWDLTNGYLIAEIYSWYFPQDIHMHSYNTGTSLDSKEKNWSLLKTFIKRRHLDIPEELIHATIHCKEGAAALMVEKMYELLTNRPVKKETADDEITFTDREYQIKLPMHARSTASQAVKNNLRITETMADSNLILAAHKAQNILDNHIEHRREERLQDPKRFNVKPTLGERCPRRAPKLSSYKTESTVVQEKNVANKQDDGINVHREATVQFKEVPVRQLDKAAIYSMPIATQPGY